MSTISAPDLWTEEHELAALERLFEIGIAAMRAHGVTRIPFAVNLATCATSTREEFVAALRNKAGLSAETILIEVAMVYKVVAERSVL